MNTEIPVEFLLPTVEELLNRTDEDLKKKWKPCKRPGKKERKAAKALCSKNLGSLFVQNEQPKPLPIAKPTLRISLAPQNKAAGSLQRKRGRPPK